ncbi:MAG: hypothetical protein EON47_19650 [Acetobacteraceae bacterium]|nr:MAG: hypothetical protein EON47_19650 [Acetobacteraceae bacterium]
MAEAAVGTLARGCGALAGICARWPRVVLALALGVALLAGAVVSQRFEMNTDTDALFPADLPWRLTERRMAEAFPQREQVIAVVVDGPTGDAADRAAAGLAAALGRRSDLFRSVQRPDGLEFFRRNGLLFLDEAAVRETTERVIAAQPLLGTLAADPSLRGIATAFGLVLTGVERGDATLESIAAPLAALAGAAVLAADPAGAGDPAARAASDGGLRRGGGRCLQPAVHRLRRAVHRPRGRFRHPAPGSAPRAGCRNRPRGR